MTKKCLLTRLIVLIITLFVCWPVTNLHAQTIDCSSSKTYFRVTKGQVATIACDTMYLLTKSAWLSNVAAKAQYDSTQKLYVKLVKDLEVKHSILDQIIKEDQRHIKSLDSILAEKNNQLKDLQNLSQRAVDNTDHAVKIAKCNRGIAIVSGASAIVLLVVNLLK